MRLYTGGAKAAEARSNLPGEARTATGELILPRYLQAPGDFELALDQYIVAASSPLEIGGSYRPRLSATVKVFPFLDLHAAAGPQSRFAARGPIYRTASLGLGWAAGYRSDIVATGGTAAGAFQAGTAPAGTGAPAVFWPERGVAVSRGGEVRLEGLNRIALDAGFLDFGISPNAFAMGNRTGAGADVSVDWALDRATFGYLASAQFNAVNPFEPAVKIVALQLRHGIGARFLLGDGGFLQLGYEFVQADAYANTWHLVTLGLGYRSAPAPTAREGESGEGGPGEMKTSQ